jgi:hypothetical protein
MGAFARFAQAMNLLDQVLRHKSEKNTNEIFHAEEAIQLDRTIRSLIVLTNVDGDIGQSAMFLQTAMCYSILIGLHDPQKSHDSTVADDRESHSWVARKAVADEVYSLQKSLMSSYSLKYDADSLSSKMTSLSKTYLSRITENPDCSKSTSPCMLYWTYQAAKTYARLYRDTGSETYLESCRVVEETLNILNRRWKAAGKFLMSSVHTEINKNCRGLFGNSKGKKRHRYLLRLVLT